MPDDMPNDMPDETPRDEFRYRATDAEGEESSGSVFAESVESLVERLSAQGLRASAVTGRATRRLFEPRKVSLEEFAVFNSELAGAARRGVPLPGAIQVLSRELQGSSMREALEAVARDISGGADVASAFARHADVFPPAYVALVRAGLDSGDLAGTLLLFSEEARLSARMRHTMARAIGYPLLVIFAAACLLSYVGWELLPAFEKMFTEMSAPRPPSLPPMTRFIFLAAPLLQWAPVLLLGLFALVWVAWRYALGSATRSRVAAKAALALPGFGPYLKAIALARFCRTLSNALASRVPVPEAVALAGLASGNAAIEEAAMRLRESVREGGRIAEGLEHEEGLFPATFVWMLSLGEGRGDVREPLGEYAKLQEETARRLGETLPMLVAMVVGTLGAVLLGLGVIAVFQPLIAIMENLAS